MVRRVVEIEVDAKVAPPRRPPAIDPDVERDERRQGLVRDVAERGRRLQRGVARTGLEHYRVELLRRRDHLRSAWIWHGPLLLACIFSAATLTQRIVPGRLRDALPVFLLLAAYAVIGIKRRVRQAAELQQEIDEISSVSPVDE